MVGLGFLPGVPGPGFAQLGYGNGVSDDGSVVVGESSSASGTQAFRWTSAGGMVGLGFLPGIAFSAASGVSADGSVIVGGGGNGPEAFTNEAFRWTSSGGMAGLGFLPGIPTNGAQTYSNALALSADGSVVVGYGSSASGEQAFRWTLGGGIVGLGYLSAGTFPFSLATALSRDGSVVVGVSNSSNTGSRDQAFRWTSGGGMVGLGFFPAGKTSFASGTSADGSVVVGSGEAPFLGNSAFIWDATHGMRSLQQLLTDDGLNLTGWTLQDARAISADGNTIIGTGRDPSGNSQAWIAVIPEPGTGLLVMAGVLGLAISRRRTA